jgi:hypothetical protein
MVHARMTPEQASQLSLAEQHDWFVRASRGCPSGSAPARAVARPGPPAVPVLLTRSARPSGRYLPPVGRHLAFGTDPATQLTVAWQVSGPVTAPFIRVADSRADLSEPIPAEVRPVVTAASAVAPATEQYYLHTQLTGLRPGTTYYYSVGHQGWDVGGASTALASFTTAPGDRAPFTFTAFGDQGVSAGAAVTAALIRARQPAFHLHAGDISYAESSGRGLITDAYDPREWDAFFTEIEPAARSIPWQIAVGNHELEPWYSADGYGGQRARFGFPASAASPQPGTYYSFAYGNVGVISLDANDISYEIPANIGYSGGAQTAWLQGTLAAFRADPEIDFIVVFFHHCAYCTCSAHGSDGGAREHWTPLFDRYAVDLVINGHNHIYERTDPLRGGAATGAAPAGATVYPASAGTTYIVAGAGGKSLYSFPAPDSYLGAPDAASPIGSVVHQPDGHPAAEEATWSSVRYTGYCLLVVDSEPGWRPGASARLRVRGVAGDGSEIDRIDLVR